MKRPVMPTPFLLILVLFLGACANVADPRGEAPIADAGADRTVLIGHGVTLDASASSDPGGQALSFSWSLVATPHGSTAQVQDAEGPLAAFVPDEVGRYVARVRVDNGRTSSDADVTLQAVEGGVLLDGAPDSPAMAATYDLWLPMISTEDHVSTGIHDDLEYAVLRTEIEIGFAVGATVAEVNELLEQLDGVIVDMLAQQRQILVLIPDPGTLDALFALIDALEAMDLVDFVNPSVLLESDEPAGVQALPDSPPPWSRIDHHLAVRAHAAWNVRAALPPFAERPQIVIADLFGEGTPGSALDAVFSGSDYEPDRPDGKEHGYHVLGIISGAFDPVPGLGPDPNDVTGIFPGTLRVRAVDLRQWRIPTLTRQSNHVIRRIEDALAQAPSAGVIVNTSLNARGHPARKTAARSWAEKVRGGSSAHIVGAGLEPRFVHFTSAGNAKIEDGVVTKRWDAADNSHWTHAALGDMTRTFKTDYPNLANIFVVENRVQTRHGSADPDTGLASRPLPGCANDGSIMGGTLSAMGTGVWSSLATSAGFKTGTSMATPQAAGIAAYAWALGPALSGPQVMARIAQSAQAAPTTTLTRGSVACNAVAPRPVVDAYDAVLAAGGDAARIALLDVDGNGVFDEADIHLFLDAFRARGGALDYSRFDLSGDGRTGEASRTERFDLDGNRSYGTASRVVHYPGGSRSVSFDERAVNDYDVLCYYAFSSLYAGDVTERNEAIGGLCAGGPVVEVTAPQEDQSHWGPTVEYRAEVHPSQDELVGDYTVFWSYELEDGETVQLESTAPGASGSATFLCRDVTLTAWATRSDPSRQGRDTVSFSVTNHQAEPWRPVVIRPNGHTVYVNVPTTPSLELEGIGTRLACAGAETSASHLRWLEGATVLADTPELTVPGDSFTTADPRTLTLRHNQSALETQLRLVPCSTGIRFDLPRCPDPAFADALQNALAEWHRQVFDAAEARRYLDRDLADLYAAVDTPMPAPFPHPPEHLMRDLHRLVGAADAAFFEELWELTTSPSASGFDASLFELQATASQQMSDDALALLIEASQVVLATYAHYAPAHEGGAGAWGLYLFADEKDRAAADVLAPARFAVEGFLTGVLDTLTGDLVERGAYDPGFAGQVAAIGAAYGALDELTPDDVVP